MALRKPRNQTPDPATLAALAALEGTNPWTRYACTLVTPLYGGGVQAGVVDRAMPIRASSIRGQLRFWWRVACGPFASSEEMFRREADIWGGIAEAGPTASKVEVRVADVKAGKPEPAHKYLPNPKAEGKLRPSPEVAPWAEAYSLFPAQGKLSEDKRSEAVNPTEVAREGVTFRLEVRLARKLPQAERDEIEKAMRWWASFGGVGARTRRGLGAVKIAGLSAVTKEEVAKAGGRLVLLVATDNATRAWQASVGRLKAFRQEIDVGRNRAAKDSPSPFGRSRWPEADTLRGLSGHAHPRHRTRVVSVDGFPRAAFGLPIVFHFKDAPAKWQQDAKGFSPKDFDPEDHILEPADASKEEKRDRMASPLILRPYWNGARWQAAALLLPGWESALCQPLKFKGQSYIPVRWPADRAARQVTAMQIEPMKDGSKLRADDPLSAFMHYFEKGR